MRTLLVILLLAGFSGAHIVAAPSLSAPKEVDLGRLNVNRLEKFKFTVRNDSAKAIKVTAIKTSCSCTDVKLDGDMTLGAGAERIMTGAVNFGGALGSHETLVGITYQGQNEQMRETAVPIRGKVVAAVVLNKALLDFGQLDIDAGIQTLAVEAAKGNSGEEWDSIRPISPVEHITVTVEEGTEMGQRLAVRLDPKGLPISTFRTTVTLQLFRRGQSLPHKIELPVTARIKGPLKATPAGIYLGAIVPGIPLERSIVISASSGIDLRELIVEKQPEGGMAELKNLASGAARVDIRIIPPARQAPFNVLLGLLHTGSGTRLSIQIIGTLKSTDTTSLIIGDDLPQNMQKQK